jgi:hypothetical protein
MAGTWRTEPYPEQMDWRTVNPQAFEPSFPDIPQGYANWNEYIKAVLTANAQGAPGPRPYNVYGGDAIGNPDVGPMEWLQHSLGYARLAPYLDQSDPQIQMMLDNMYYAGNSYDTYSPWGDQFTNALMGLGAFVGGSAALGAFAPAAAEAAAGGIAATGVGEAAAGGAGAYGLAAGAPELLTAGGAVGAGSAAPAMAGAGGIPAAAAAGGGLLGGLGALGPYAAIAGPAVSAGSSLLGGILAGNAAKDAAQTQVGAAQAANDQLLALYNQQRADMMPYLGAGYAALGQLGTMADQPLPYGAYTPTPTLQAAPYGFDPNAYAFDASALRFNPSAYQFDPGATFDPNLYAFHPEYLRFNAPNAPLDPTQYAFTPNAPVSADQYRFAPPSGQQVLNDDPGYQFRLEQGMKALNAQSAAKGGLMSGGALKAAQRYGQGLASQEYGAAYNRALGQNQLAYGRALQENQDLYGRSRDKNVMDWQRAQYGNETTYNRALGENQLRYARELQGNQMGYERALTGNQLDYNRRLAQNQMTYDRALTGNQLDYNRALTQNQLGYERGLQGNQLQYGRAYQQNADEAARALSGYQTNLNTQLALRNQQTDLLGRIAGLGSGAQSQQAGLSANLAQQLAGNITGAGASQAAGQVGASNALTQGLSGVGNAANSYLQMQLLNSLLQRRT